MDLKLFSRSSFRAPRNSSCTNLESKPYVIWVNLDVSSFKRFEKSRFCAGYIKCLFFGKLKRFSLTMWSLHHVTLVQIDFKLFKNQKTWNRDFFLFLQLFVSFRTYTIRIYLMFWFYMYFLWLLRDPKFDKIADLTKSPHFYLIAVLENYQFLKKLLKPAADLLLIVAMDIIEHKNVYFWSGCIRLHTYLIKFDHYFFVLWIKYQM